MGRTTRAKAAEVAEKHHSEKDAVLDIQSENNDIDTKAGSITLENNERTPLGEIEHNSGGNKSDENHFAEEKQAAKGKRGGKKGAKGRKKNLAATTAIQPDTLDELPEVVADDREAVSSPASEAAAEDLVQDIPDTTLHVPVQDSRSQTPPSPAVKFTRIQLAKTTPAEWKSLVGEKEVQQQQAAPVQPGKETTHLVEVAEDANEPVTQLAVDAPPSPMPNALPNVIDRLCTDTPGKRTASNKENIGPERVSMRMAEDFAVGTPQGVSSYDALEAAIVEATTPSVVSRSTSMVRPQMAEQSGSQTEDPIAAMDALDDEVEKVSAQVPDVQTSPEKPKGKKAWEKPAPVVRTTKTSRARISLAQGDTSPANRPPAVGKLRPSTSTGLGRSGSLRRSTAIEPKAMNQRVSLAGTKKPDSAVGGEKMEVVIPHSKPRPVSVSFPSPPPAVKSTKAPTKPTFQLPGEAIAAKLKVQREERTKKEAEDEAKKVAFKARPIPAGLKKAPSVRQTTASKARESLMGGKPTATAPTASHKRAHSVAVTSTRTRTVSREAASNSRNSSKLAPDTLKVNKRPSTTTADIGKPRASIATSSAGSSANRIAGQRMSSINGKGTTKGREVFNRAARVKEAAEKDKREKEAAAKKARAEAAERGRQLSKEWAEKQRLKKLRLIPEANPAQVAEAAKAKGENALSATSDVEAVTSGDRAVVPAA